VIRLLTMSDLRLLPQTLTLYRSVTQRTALPNDEVEMAVLGLDEATRSFLRRHPLRGVELLELAALEGDDPELAATRSERPWLEYCWTVIPSLCHWQLETAPADAVVVWLDADIELLGDVRELAAALGDGSLLLTPHRYNRAYPSSAPAIELTKRYGRFNGGSIAFRRDEQGRAAVGLWRERTLQWCADRPEPGRYGNQLYLDDFPVRFDRARILATPGGVLGPWNGGRFSVRRTANGLTADGQPLHAYHFQSLRLRRASPRLVQLLSPNVFPLRMPEVEARAEPHYRIARRERQLLWVPYLRRVEQAVAEVIAREPAFAMALSPRPSAREVLAAVELGLRLRSSVGSQPLIDAVRRGRRRFRRWRAVARRRGRPRP